MKSERQGRKNKSPKAVHHNKEIQENKRNPEKRRGNDQNNQEKMRGRRFQPLRCEKKSYGSLPTLQARNYWKN